MASSMFESILEMVTPEMKQSIASRLGESPQSAQNGLATATAATLAGMANNSGDPGFLDQLMQLAGRAGGQNLPASLGSIASSGPSSGVGELINRFQALVFGNQQGRAESLISQQAGLSAASAGGLLKMAAPLILGFLAKMHGSGNLNSSTLGNMLKAAVPSLGSFVPSGLFGGTAKATGEAVGRVGSRIGEAAGRVSDDTYRVGAAATRYAERLSRPTNRWLWAIPAAIVGLLLLGWLAFKGTRTETTTSVAGSTAPSAQFAVGELQTLKLPDGTTINVPANGIEAKLVAYLQGNRGAANEVAGLDFDRLLFDTNSATLQPASSEQLNNVAAILNAYPAVKVRLGGYTDNTGDASQNLQLSQQRADNVLAELAKRGIDPARLSATGYGQGSAVADNSTEEGRQKNRRISIRVAEN